MPDVVLAWSGGKDSTLALARLRADARYHVVALLTTVTREYDRISMHGVRRSVLEAQVHALGLPLIEASISSGAGNAEYESAFGLALSRARGAFSRASAYRVRRPLPRRCARLPGGAARVTRVDGHIPALGRGHRGTRRALRTCRVPRAAHLRRHESVGSSLCGAGVRRGIAGRVARFGGSVW